jgi:tetratricopeptide (TPR) repeat protein
MTEARQLAYLELVQQLLDSGVGTEDNILDDNLALVDAGLIVVLREVAESLRQENDPDLTNIFDWLVNISNKLVRDLELDTDDEFDFFSDVLAMIGLTKGNAKAIYARFQSDVLLLNDRLLEIIPAWSKAVFLDSNKQEQELLASFLAIFATMIAQFPLGRRSINLELAIAGYHAALAGYTRHEFPGEWAAVQNNLANTYHERIEGDEAENIELAILGYEAALTIYTQQDFPSEWSTTQMNLANIYMERLKGSESDNIETAISKYHAALEVGNRNNFPINWAETQNNLAVAYTERKEGNKLQNIEMAINAYKSALEVRTSEYFPYEWATTQINLANAYCERIEGDKSQNIEIAIHGYNKALQVITHNNFPVDWATIQSNLADAYCERIHGDRSANIEFAITSYQYTLEVFKYEDFPVDWARTQYRLANLYSIRIQGDIKDNLKQSQDFYQAALGIYKADEFPDDWAKVQLDIARLNIKGFHNYVIAREYLQNTYEHLLENKYNLDLLAEVMFELAQCLHHIGQLEQAKILLKDTVRVYQRLEKLPQIAAATGALGNLEMQMGKLTNARLHLQQARDLYESLGRQKNVEAIQRLQEYLIKPIAG